MTTEQVHEVGVKRHGTLWLHANMKAVEELWGSSINVSDPETKRVISRIVLRVLDAARLARGYEWRSGASEWTKQAKPAEQER